VLQEEARRWNVGWHKVSVSEDVLVIQEVSSLGTRG
jgi:hypothetical protein